jgi:hypothetical protein
MGLEMYCETVTAYFPSEVNEDNEDLWRIVYDDEEKEDFIKDQLDLALKLYAEQKQTPVDAAANVDRTLLNPHQYATRTISESLPQCLPVPHSRQESF